MKLFLVGSALAAIVLLNGCDSACCQDVALAETIAVKGNQTPIPVITGLPAKAPCGTELTASGTQSHDPDGTIASYQWQLDGDALAGEGSALATLPCDGKNHTVCLTVTDNKGLSQTTCQTIVVDNGTPAPQPQACDLNPLITYEKADEMQYKFYCTDSTYNGVKIDDATAAECEWSATKYFKESDESYTHGQKGPVKWINVDPDKFRALDLTLTIKKEDCKKTITKHYFIPQDLPY